jgi:nickel-dependent lactate racemase
MTIFQTISDPGEEIPDHLIAKVLQEGLADHLSGKKVLVLVPDHTRTLPLPKLAGMLIETLRTAKEVDFMIALGTHPPLSKEAIDHLFDLTGDRGKNDYTHSQIFNHAWNDPGELVSLGEIPSDEIHALAGDLWHPSMSEKVDIRINRAVMDYDHILILGPVFPHEVVGFSGGEKYLFPGISGPEMINATHWLGALAGVVGTIGIKDTPVRRMIHTAASHMPIPTSLVACVMQGHELQGLFVGETQSTWQAAADLSAERNITWLDKPVRQVLSCAPLMYDELWTAAKAMYKLEPAVETGGEVIIYAPHLDVVSHVHGKYIYEVGYHTLGYFLKDWERYKHIPLGVLAHSTHVRGSGIMENGVEKPNVKVTLASKIPAEDCAQLNLGYMDPAKIDLHDYEGRLDEGVMVVPRAGEMLYRVKRDTVRYS